MALEVETKEHPTCHSCGRSIISVPEVPPWKITVTCPHGESIESVYCLGCTIDFGILGLKIQPERPEMKVIRQRRQLDGG